MNSNLQDKLSQFEATPPGAVWDKIAETLDADLAFPQRLYNYQEQPDIKVWNKLHASLEQPSPAKVVPFTTRYRKPIRYISAASIIAVILVSTTLLMKRTEAGSVPEANEKIIPVKESIVQRPGTTSSINTINQTETIAAYTNKSSVYKEGIRQKRVLSFITPQSILSAIVMRERFVPKEVNKKELFNFSAVNDYMVYSDGDGNAMKLPKKLFSLVNCPDGDGSCKERIHQLQQKLSSTAMSTDFTGILEMLRQLQ